MSGKVIPVKVAVRCRPLVDKEEMEGCQCCIQFVKDEPQLVVGKDKAFTYDFVFKPDVDQSVVYDDSVRPLVQGLFKGYNATVLAYGQTGSGKTYSMGGGYEVSLSSKMETMGIIPRVIKELFDGIKELDSKYLFAIKISYLELYKEDLQDLLVSASKREKDQVVIRDDVGGGIKLVGMTEIPVSTYEETMKQLEEGSQSRTTGSTAMNNHSSRSHAIFTIHLERTCRIDSHDFLKAKFHLVDLAGSERIKKTHAEGERLKEGININKGLLSLGNVISALGDDNAKKNHIPYRDSKLTRLLQDSLGGNSHTLMVACISPADSNLEETISTLRYADRARKIKNKPIINQDPQAAEVLRLRQLVQELQGKVVMNGGSVAGSRSQDCAALEEKIAKLEADKRDLIVELDSAVQRSTQMINRLIKAEAAKEELDLQLREVQDKLKQATAGLRESLGGGKVSEEVMSHTLALVQDAQDQIGHINNKNLSNDDEDEEEEEDVDEEKKEEVVDGEVKEERGEGGGGGGEGSEELHEELRTNHVKRQAQLNRELQDLNAMLMKKQELASKMLCNDQQMLEMKEHYEHQSKEMEAEMEKLQKEKDELMQALQSVKANKANQKLSEQRRKKVQELESSIGELRKKMVEQSRMIRMKEQSEKQVEKLNSEIRSMKQQRVRLMRQMKEDSDHFRKLKADMAREVLQLKSQGRKRQAEMAKLERQHMNQQAVLKRKAEEAAAANNRLKEMLMRQKRVLEDKNKKQDSAEVTGAGARARKMVKDEMDFMLTVEEARVHLKEQLTARKEMNERCAVLRDKLDESEQEGDGKTDDNKASMLEELKEMDQQIDICNAQISELQQKLLDVDQDEKSKSRWSNIHTIMEAKCALKWLVNAAVGAKMEAGVVERKVQDTEMQHATVLKLVEKSEEQIKKISKNHEHEMHELRKQYENKILYLLSQMRKENDGVSEGERIDGLKRIVELQACQLQQLCELNDTAEYKNNDNSVLKNMRVNGSAKSLLPPLTLQNTETTKWSRKTRRLTRYDEVVGNLSCQEEGKKSFFSNLSTLPQVTKHSSASQLLSQAECEDMNRTFVKSDSVSDENKRVSGNNKAVRKKRSSPRSGGDKKSCSDDSTASSSMRLVHEDDTFHKKRRIQPLKTSYFNEL